MKEGVKFRNFMRNFIPISPLKQKRWLNGFVFFTVCQVVLLRDVGFSWSKVRKKLNLKSGSSAQYAYKRYLKNNGFEARKSSGRPPKLSNKNQKDLDTDVLKDPKTSLKRIIVAHNNVSCYDTISRGQLDEFCKIGSLKKKNTCFRSKLVINMLKKLFSFGQNVVSLTKQECAELLRFF